MGGGANGAGCSDVFGCFSEAPAGSAEWSREFRAPNGSQMPLPSLLRCWLTSRRVRLHSRLLVSGHNARHQGTTESARSCMRVRMTASFSKPTQTAMVGRSPLALVVVLRSKSLGNCLISKLLRPFAMSNLARVHNTLGIAPSCCASREHCEIRAVHSLQYGCCSKDATCTVLQRSVCR